MSITQLQRQFINLTALVRSRFSARLCQETGCCGTISNPITPCLKPLCSRDSWVLRTQQDLTCSLVNCSAQEHMVSGGRDIFQHLERDTSRAQV